VVERVMGIEPTLSAWEAEVLPLNYTRSYTLIVSILGGVAKRFSQSSWIFVSTPVAQGVCAYPKNETRWIFLVF
jgi:hypothetical protein